MTPSQLSELKTLTHAQRIKRYLPLLNNGRLTVAQFRYIIDAPIEKITARNGLNLAEKDTGITA